MTIKQKIIWRLWYEIAYYPYYIMLWVVTLLWLVEGVSIQSGWTTCPARPA